LTSKTGTGGQQSLVKKYRIDASDQQTRLAWVQLTESDMQLLRKAGEFLEPEADAIAREFYDHSFKFPAFVAKIEEAGTTRRALEGAQTGYFRDLLSGRVDQAHCERALFIGENHTRLDVKPRWVIGNYATYAQLVFDRLSKHMEGDELLKTMLAFVKAFSLDGSLLTEAYVGGLMDRMVDVYQRLGPAAESLSGTSGQVNSATGEIARAIQQVASGASEQTAAVTSANAATAQMQQALMLVAESSRAAADKSQQSTTAAEQGSIAARETAAAMVSINQAVVTTSTQIEALSESGREIGAITQTISEIAAQTNLLALNAAIEAARAGDMGRGFAVVADEVRSLAERSASAAKDIAALIEKVQSGVARSVESMSTVVRDVNNGAEKAHAAGEVLERIVATTQELSSEVAAIERNASEADQGATALARVMSDVGSLAETNAAASEEVSAGTEQVTAQVGDMAGQADGLNQVAGELNEFLTWIGAMEANTTARIRAVA
jgi:methyl-accepting chemotaxis protein